jgi:hypothetical protein
MEDAEAMVKTLTVRNCSKVRPNKRLLLLDSFQFGTRDLGPSSKDGAAEMPTSAPSRNVKASAAPTGRKRTSRPRG